MPSRGKRLIPLLLLPLLAAGPQGASGASQEQLSRLKSLQQHILLSEPAEKREKLEKSAKRKKAEAIRAASRKAGVRTGARRGSGRQTGARRRVAPPRNDVDNARARRSPAPDLSTSAATAFTNVLANTRSGEPSGSCQSEVSVAAIGRRMVMAWNDGISVYGTPWPEDTQGFAYSSDGGATWTDGGPIPNGGQFVWSSDPVVVANEKTGDFYYAGLFDAFGRNGIAVIKGAFCGNTFSWGNPVVAVDTDNGLALLDKEWLAVDSLSGNLYVSYSHFGISGGVFNTNSIRFVRSQDDNQTWSAPVTLSAPGDAGLVQGSRPVAGPDGELYVVWHAIGQSSGPGKNSPFGRDFLRIRKSTTFGQSFAAQVTADSVFSNFGNGAPGFNRGIGITFPGVGVDRTTGPNRGRVYLTWNESLNFYNDDFPEPGLSPSRSEIETNNAPGVATAFTPGQILRGVVSVTGNPGDLDYWKWDAVQGQTAIFWLDSLSSNLDPAFRIFCSDGLTHLAFSHNGIGGIGLLVFTAPTTATYYLRVASYTGTKTGSYRVLTTLNTPQADRARDQRDIFVKSSANGTAWGPTVRVNDSPGYFEDWLPEVQVDGAGRVFAASFDWRDAVSICGGGSNAYLYRSDDAGATWTPGSRVSDQTTNWTAAFSTLIPNQGDYIGLLARDTTAVVSWADGRNGDPDVFFATTSTASSCVPSPVCLVDTTTTLNQITVTWSAPQGFTAELRRRTESGPFQSLGPVTANASDQIVYQDDAVTPGVRYSYVLLADGYCQGTMGSVAVTPVCSQAPVSVASASATTEQVTVTWSAPDGLNARVERRTEQGPFEDLGPVTATGNQIVFVDTAVTPGATYTYRLAVTGFCTATAGQATVTVPGLALGIQELRPNPAQHDVWVTFRLGSPGPARLELLDVSGRKIHSEDVGSLGPGLHTRNVTAGVSVKAGLYFVRLEQPGHESVKAVSIR